MRKMILLFLIVAGTIQQANAQSEDSTDTYRDKVDELLILGGSEQVFKTAVGNILKMYKDKNSDNQELVLFLDKLEERMLKESLNELTDMLVPVYKKNFTAEDLDQLIAFYKTDIGKKLVEKTPAIMEESMQIGQLWGRKVAEEVQAELEKN
ncbi:hypothetical protein NBRC110019_06280 [Neptunitalea chrysea]|uniref:DUF2059 domain-containing protein n=1 Tax=Neptunitalea chrysea TaxID=1647581 RepID=A0A9W6ETT2_9FLAO|nr:DUF2059 domain-containing protein [Neptunitalea chrysea]GLB51589.1 hypothetical protein NBRC110019_06280 [Neptunitalea chrysea]